MFKKKVLPEPDPILTKEELISEDGNFNLNIHHYTDQPTQYIIIPQHPFISGIAAATTLHKAMIKSRQELSEAVELLQTRIRQLDKMIEEETAKTEKPADTPIAAGSPENNTSPAI